MEDIYVKELKERLEKGEKFHFLDVREEWEYEEDNLGALNIPLGELPMKLAELENGKTMKSSYTAEVEPEAAMQRNLWKARASAKSEMYWEV